MSARIERERILLSKIEERDRRIKKLEEVAEFANGLSSRVDYLEDELAKLLEALERIDKDVSYLKNPFSRIE